MDDIKIITPPNLLGIERKIAQANKKYHVILVEYVIQLLYRNFRGGTFPVVYKCFIARSTFKDVLAIGTWAEIPPFLPPPAPSF